MDIATLLAPVSGELPAGIDLTESPERQEIELAFDDDAGSVDWRATIGLIEQQVAQTKDVWLAIYLARAGAQFGRLDIVVTGCQMLAGLFEQYWDTLHPAMEDYGFQGRKGPCESLTRIGPFLGPLKRVALIEHPRLGSYSGADLERFEREGGAADGFGMFRRAVEEMEEGALASVIDSLDSLRDAIRRADLVLTDKAEGDSGTDFKPTYEAIDSIRRALAPFAGLVADEPSARDTGDMDPPQAANGPKIGGRVESRDDVIRTIDAITEYYRQREPGSPIPVALKRVRAWVTMDFMAVLRDIAPNSVSEAGTVLLARPEEEADSGY